MTDQITVPRATWDAMQEALNKLIKRDQRNTCQHEETHRGGVIWEICEGCGMKWADDRGGKPKWRNPPEWDAAELALTAANAVSHPQATEPQAPKVLIMGDSVTMHLQGHFSAKEAFDALNSLPFATVENPQATEPAGWKLVPVEPTPEMIAAIWAYKSDSLQDCYRALLAAAPEAKQ